MTAGRLEIGQVRHLNQGRGVIEGYRMLRSDETAMAECAIEPADAAETRRFADAVRVASNTHDPATCRRGNDNHVLRNIFE